MCASSLWQEGILEQLMGGVTPWDNHLSQPRQKQPSLATSPLLRRVQSGRAATRTALASAIAMLESPNRVMTAVAAETRPTPFESPIRGMAVEARPMGNTWPDEGGGQTAGSGERGRRPAQRLFEELQGYASLARHSGHNPRLKLPPTTPPFPPLPPSSGGTALLHFVHQGGRAAPKAAPLRAHICWA